MPMRQLQPSSTLVRGRLGSTVPASAPASPDPPSLPSGRPSAMHACEHAPAPFIAPSSHCSPLSTTPSPHLALTHVVRQALAARSLLAEPLSHSSPLSLTPSPHLALTHVVRQASAFLSLLFAPLSHSSLKSIFPFPHGVGQPISCKSAASMLES